MKLVYQNRLLVALLMWLSAACTGEAVAQSAEEGHGSRPTIALLDLESEEVPAEGLRILSDLMREEFVKSDSFRVINRYHMERILNEQRLQLDETVSRIGIVQVGALLGAQKMAAGRIGRLGNLRLISLQLIDVETGRIERVETTDFVGPLEDLRQAIRAAAQRLIGIGGFHYVRYGFIHVTSVPPGARVHVAGLFEGNTPVRIRVDSAGTYPVTITMPEHLDWEQRVEVSSGETSFLEAVLVRLIPSEIAITSTPEGARAFMADRYVGTTPTTVRVDSAGTYPVRIVAEGHHEWQQDIVVRSGEDAAVNAALEPIQVEPSFIQTGRGALMTFMIPYATLAAEGTIFALGVKSARPYVGALLVGGPGAYFLTLRNVSDTDMSMARAGMIISSALWGTTWGALSSVTLAGEKGGENIGPRAAVGLSVAVSAAAIWVSSRYTANSDMSGRRVKLINLGGFMGSSLGLGLPYLFDVSEPRVYVGSLVLGGITGVIYAASATSGLDTTDEEADEEPAGIEIEPSTPEGAELRFLRPWVSVGRVSRTTAVRRNGDIRYGVSLFEYRFR